MLFMTYCWQHIFLDGSRLPEYVAANTVSDFRAIHKSVANNLSFWFSTTFSYIIKGHLSNPWISVLLSKLAITTMPTVPFSLNHFMVEVDPGKCTDNVCNPKSNNLSERMTPGMV